MAGEAAGGQGVNQAIQRFVARPGLHPFLHRAGALDFGDQFFGAELGEIFFVEGRVAWEVDVAGAGLYDLQAAVDQRFALVDAERFDVGAALAFDA